MMRSRRTVKGTSLATVVSVVAPHVGTINRASAAFTSSALLSPVVLIVPSSTSSRASRLLSQQQLSLSLPPATTTRTRRVFPTAAIVAGQQLRFHSTSSIQGEATEKKAPAKRQRKKRAPSKAAAAMATPPTDTATRVTPVTEGPEAPAPQVKKPKARKPRQPKAKIATVKSTQEDTAQASAAAASPAISDKTRPQAAIPTPRVVGTTTAATTTPVDSAPSDDGLQADDDVEEFMSLLETEAKAREQREAEEKSGGAAAKGTGAASATAGSGGSPQHHHDDDHDHDHDGLVVGEQPLSADQLEAIRLAVDERRNVFVTGGAGTGKSLVIREIVRRLRAKSKRGGAVYITATTGVAALNVRGSTIHSFAGVGLGKGSNEEVLKLVRRNRKAAGRWTYCSTLVIDEVSMMEVSLLGKLDYVARKIRKRDEPFGGIQVILCGDFLQLPPVGKDRFCMDDSESSSSSPSSVFAGDFSFVDDFGNNGGSTASRGGGGGERYVFQTQAWRDLGLSVVMLTHKHRQNLDPQYQRVLEDVRNGVLPEDTRRALLARCVDLENGRVNVNANAAGGANPFEEALVAAAAAAPSHRSKTQEELVKEVQERVAQSGTDPFYVQLCATNNEVDTRNAKHFSALVPYTSPVAPTQLLRVPSLDGRERGGSDAGEQSRGHPASDPLRPLQIYVAEDYLLEPAKGSKAIERTRVPNTIPGESSHSSSSAFHVNAKRSKRGAGKQQQRHASGGPAKLNGKVIPVRFEDSAMPTVVPLKVGARVMLLHNVSQGLGLVNGSVGEVTGFLHPMEMIELAILAPQERGSRTKPGALESPEFRLLRERGGFQNAADVMRCVDTFTSRSLVRVLREAAELEPELVSYQSVYGQQHWETLLEITRSAHLWHDHDHRGGSGGSSSAEAVDEDALLDTLVVKDKKSRVVRVPGEARLVHSRDVTLASLTPERRRTGRLPVVKIDLTMAPISKLEERMAASQRGRDGRAHRPLWQPPKHVYAFVSPHTQEWYRATQPMASRTQIPLRHAWAITVHKSQGLTIPQLEIDMGRFFSEGQAYVALSRATALDGVRLLNFTSSGVRACAIAKSFYDDLARKEHGKPSSSSSVAGVGERGKGYRGDDDESGERTSEELMSLLDSF